jgi:NADH:ubiquinone oxidoreductase subunit 6 (subunit J)
MVTSRASQRLPATGRPVRRVRNLIYIGAVAILIVFAILLTRSEPPSQSIFSDSWLVGGIAVRMGC